MDWFVRRFIKSSLAWLGAGVVLGALMAIMPELVIYRPAHMHMNLLGFVSMMIFGVGYHVLPRVAGSPLRWRNVAGMHWWVANTGLLAMASGFILRPHASTVGTAALAFGALLSAAGAFCFIVNIWSTLDRAERRSRSVMFTNGSRSLPVREGII